MNPVHEKPPEFKLGHETVNFIPEQKNDNESPAVSENPDEKLYNRKTSKPVEKSRQHIKQLLQTGFENP